MLLYETTMISFCSSRSISHLSCDASISHLAAPKCEMCHSVASDIRCHYEWNKHRFYVQSFSISAPALWAPEEQGQNWEFVLVWVCTIALPQTAYPSTKYLLNTWRYVIWSWWSWYDMIWCGMICECGSPWGRIQNLKCYKNWVRQNPHFGWCSYLLAHLMAFS